MTRVFYNSRAADARQGKVRGQGRSPTLVVKRKGLRYCLLTASK
jgi:hypothetical protein